MTIREMLLSKRDYIRQQLMNGATFSDLAKEFNCNSGTVWYFAKGEGIPFKVKQVNRGSAHLYRDEILKLWNSGMSGYKISKQLGLNKHFITRNLRKWGIDTSINSSVNRADAKHGKNRSKIAEKKNEIIQLYQGGKSLNELATMFGFNSGSIYTLLHKNSIEIRPRDCYSYDQTYFDKIDTPNKAYILGLLFADGNVMKSMLRLSLAVTDKCVVAAIKSELKYMGPLDFRKSKTPNKQDQWCLRIFRKGIDVQLAKLGITPNKTWTIRIPSIDIVPENLRVFYVCGFIMGDGSIKIGDRSKPNDRGNYINFTGNYDFLHGLISWLPVPVTNIYQRYKDRPLRESSHSAFVHCKADFIKLGSWLYSDSNLAACNLLAFDRKCTKFRSYLANSV